MQEPITDRYAALTEKEKQTLRLIVRGHDAKSIARHLGLSVHTINERLRDARRKLAVSSSRASTRAVASPIGWVRSQVVERSITPSCSPLAGSCTGAAQHTQLCTIGAKCSALNTIAGWAIR